MNKPASYTKLTELHAKSSFFKRCLVSLSGGSLIKWNRRSTLVTRFIGPISANTRHFIPNYR